jgi:peptidyl-prolyl cis-trans isomerase SurA
MKISILAALCLAAAVAGAQQPAPPPAPPAPDSGAPAPLDSSAPAPPDSAAPALPDSGAPVLPDSNGPSLRLPSLSGDTALLAPRADSPQAPLPVLRAPGASNASGDYSVDRIIAVVGDQPIMWSEVQEQLYQRRAQGLQIPTDSAAYNQLVSQIVNELVDTEVLVQKAKAEKIDVTDEEVSAQVEQQIKSVRGRFSSDAEYREALRTNGVGTPEEYRRSLIDQAKRAAMQQKLMAKLRQEGKVIPVTVSEADVTAAFEKNKGQLPKRPATVTFRQIVIAPQPSEAAKARARAKAESLLVELKKGGNFEQIAKRESMDPQTKETGGDLGWNRRGRMVPEFDRMMFALPPGQISPIVETTYGYHIIRVDRVQPAEVKARHILIRPAIDSADVARAKARADTVAMLWRAGAKFDSLVAKYHDPIEEKVVGQPFPRTELPASYATAFEGKGVNAVTDPFTIEDKQRGVPKYVVAQLTSVQEGGDYTVADLRGNIRDQLAEERSIRRVLDGLRKQTYVSIRLPGANEN